MKVTVALLIITRLAAAIPSKSTEPFWYYSKVNETDSRPSLPEDSKTVLRRAGEQADLRIASKRAYYDNNKPYGESEVITLYIYNAGPNRAVAPEIRAGYGGSMDQHKATTTLRQVHEWRQPSQDIKHASLAWTSLPNPSSRIDGSNMVTTLPDVQAGVLMELNMEFPMTHATSYVDKTVKASVSSSTTDPRKENDEATYIITPNHHNNGQKYWNTPGNLVNLDFNGLTAEPLSQADLRIASVRERYNNNLPYGENEVLTFLVFNDGPTIATRPVLTAGYTTSMDYDKMSSGAEQVWDFYRSHCRFFLPRCAHPDTLVYLDPTTIQVGQDKLRLGYWIPVRMLWVGAAVRGMSPDGGMTLSYVTNIEPAKGSEFRSAQPHMVSQSHSYVIGTGAVVTYIEAGDNRRAGSLMGQQFTNYRMDPQPDGHAPFGPGDRFRYAIIHENMRSIEYLGDGMTDETQIDPPPTP
ncbi:nuclease, partial [Metarhizium majus ARSEF 297]